MRFEGTAWLRSCRFLLLLPSARVECFHFRHKMRINNTADLPHGGVKINGSFFGIKIEKHQNRGISSTKKNLHCTRRYLNNKILSFFAYSSSMVIFLHLSQRYAVILSPLNLPKKPSSSLRRCLSSLFCHHNASLLHTLPCIISFPQNGQFKTIQPLSNFDLLHIGSIELYCKP